jgi:hypothetical protein
MVVRFQVLTATSMMFRAVFWVILPYKMIVDRRFRGVYSWRQYAPLKRRSTIILHGSITQKTALNKIMVISDSGVEAMLLPEINCYLLTTLNVTVLTVTVALNI